MALTVLEDKLHEYLTDVYAMEKGVLRQLDGLIALTDAQQMRVALRQHKDLTREQIATLERLLEAHGIDPSALKDAGTEIAAVFRALGGLVRHDKDAGIVRDTYITEHVEIAAYELLERLALAAGDSETARVSAVHRDQEDAMARTIASYWDKAIEEVLAEEGVLSQARDPRFTREQETSPSRPAQPHPPGP